MLRRRLFQLAWAALGAYGLGSSPSAHATPPEIKMPDGVTEQKVDFETKGIEGWTQAGGQWVVEDFAGAPVGKKALLQRATKNEFNVIIAPAGPFTDVDVSVKFDPLSGKEDASGGIVFRFTDGKYYVIRANALEGNFRLYSYDRGRRQLASASVKAPALGQWHLLRVVAVGDHIQGWLDGALLLDHRDSRFKSGRVGLWTKADSITAFNDFTIRGVTGGA
jgi:3-keto-disaccharide hydrolase